MSTIICVDFNARTVHDRVSLETVGARRSRAMAPVEVGDWIILLDEDELRCGAKVESNSEGELEARPAWELIEFVIPEGQDSDTDVERHLRRLEAALDPRGPDYREVLRALPHVIARIGEAEAHFLRHRAALAFGYRDLARLQLDDALALAPTEPRYLDAREHLDAQTAHLAQLT